jgi:hypothetical protein
LHRDTRRRRVAALGAAALTAALARDAWPGGERDHDGFFLRLAAGPAYLRGSSPDVDGTLSGSGVALDVAIGGAVARNLILYGFVAGQRAWDVDYRTSIRPELAPIGPLNADADVVGAGLNWYAMPSNVHFSIGLGLAQLRVAYDDGGGVLGTESGVGYDLMVGKEWWASAQWSLGAALRVLGGFHMEADTNGLGREKDAWRVVSLAALFTATFN